MSMDAAICAIDLHHLTHIVVSPTSPYLCINIIAQCPLQLCNSNVEGYGLCTRLVHKAMHIAQHTLVI